MALAVLALLNDHLRNKVVATRLVLSVALFFGLLDGLKVAGLNMHLFDFIPFFDMGMAWFIPTAIAMIVSIFVLPKQIETDLKSA